MLGKLCAEVFPAEMCDQSRFMGTLSPSGLTLVGMAQQDLNMEAALTFEAAGKIAWVEANNLPGPAKMCCVLADPACSKQLDWLWFELGSVPVSDTLLFRRLISAVRQQLAARQ